MKSATTLASLLLLALLLGSAVAYPTFAEYVVQFGKNYNSTQYATRQATYEANVLGFSSITNYVPGVNEFTDWTEEEVRGLSTLKQLPKEQQVSSADRPVPKLGAPTSVDWRNSNIITSIKNQGSCGACWSFTSAGLMESHLVSNGSQSLSIDLSEQYILECTSRSNCAGGYIQYGLDQIASKCAQESQYSYIGPSLYGGSICSAGGVDTKTKRSSYYDITDTELINLLAARPVAVAVASTGWSGYSSGTMTCSSANQIDHAVIAVGYTPDAIIIKNSWGTSWGINGYALISRTAGSNCKILSQAHVLTNWSAHLVSLAVLALLLLLF